MVLPAGCNGSTPTLLLLLLVLVGLVWPPVPASPVATGPIGDDRIAPETGYTSCSLPAEFGFNEQVTNMEDCPSLDRFRTVPMALSSHGVHPVVCCPQHLDNGSKICLPSDPLCPSYGDPNQTVLAELLTLAGTVEKDTAESAEKADQLEDLIGSRRFPTMEDRVCPDAQVCTTVSRCPAIKDLPTWPVFAQTCGFDTAESQTMICCFNESVLSVPIDPQPPRFQSRGKPYPCEDRHELCAKWREKGGCKLDRHFNVNLLAPANAWVDSQTMFTFMAATCPATCGYCRDKGCVDEHEKCPFFASQAACSSSEYGPFMVHSCRESCGVCGFLSPFNTEIQKTPDGSGTFSDPEAASFRCGQFKLIAEINGIAEASPEDSTTTQEATEINGIPEERTSRQARAINAVPVAESNSAVALGFEPWDSSSSRIFSSSSSSNSSSSIFSANSTVASLICSGTVISDRWILSAASCFNDIWGQGEVKLNTIRNTIRTGTSHVEKIETRRVFKHPKYKYGKAYDNVALVELGRRIVYDFDKFGDTPTCLDSGKEDLVNRLATIQGFGLTEAGLKGSLLEGNVTIISNEECRTKLGIHNITIAKKKQVNSVLPNGLNTGLLCTEDKDPTIINETTGEKLFRSPCSGDGGGPLFLRDQNKSTLVGIIAGGVDCKSGLPSWYTKMSFFRPWIRCIMETSKQRNLTKVEIAKMCGSVVPSEPLTHEPIFPDIGTYVMTKV